MNEYEMNIGQATEIIERAATMIDFMSSAFATSSDMSLLGNAGVYEILSRVHGEIMEAVEVIRFNRAIA